MDIDQDNSCEGKFPIDQFHFLPTPIQSDFKSKHTK